MVDTTNTLEHKLTVSLQLYCHLMNLMDGVLAGDVEKLSEFQYFIQFAPESMREEIHEQMEKRLQKIKVK